MRRARSGEQRSVGAREVGAAAPDCLRPARARFALQLLRATAEEARAELGAHLRGGGGHAAGQQQEAQPAGHSRVWSLLCDLSADKRDGMKFNCSRMENRRGAHAPRSRRRVGVGSRNGLATAAAGCAPLAGSTLSRALECFTSVRCRTHALRSWRRRSLPPPLAEPPPLALPSNPNPLTPRTAPGEHQAAMSGSYDPAEADVRREQGRQEGCSKLWGDSAREHCTRAAAVQGRHWRRRLRPTQHHDGTDSPSRSNTHRFAGPRRPSPWVSGRCRRCRRAAAAAAVVAASAHVPACCTSAALLRRLHKQQQR